MRRYRVEYTCALDPGCPVFAMHVRAENRERAIEAFWNTDIDDDGDWTIVSVEVRP